MSAAPNASAAPAYTDAQRRAIRTTGHTLLEAGAGTGKTTTLVGKMLHALGADVIGERAAAPCELSEIAAITFTTAAAADLRRKLRRALRDHAGRDADPRWRRLVYEVDRARIGTIHAFCGQLLRECALPRGLDPAFGVLDAGEAATLRDECARGALYRQTGARDADASELVFQFGAEGAVALIGHAMDRADAADEAFAAWCAPDGRPALDALRARVEGLGGAWRAHDARGAALAAAVLRLARDARRRYGRELGRRGALDYDALVAGARGLLRDDAEARDALRGRLRWLFIDEFQDTDPAQRDIAYALCGVREALAGAAPARAPSLCVVGDPKQSVYGFRRADVTLWNAVQRDFRALGAAEIPLVVNYRSRAPLLGLVNATFGALMPAPGDPAAPDHQVRYRPLAAQRDFAGDDALVELLPLPADGSAADRRREEARLIARRVHAMVEGKEAIAWDGTGSPTPVRYRDVALLFRSATDVRLYEAELRRLRVPCYVAAGDGFFATREVRDVRLLLTALADPHDDVAWFGLLRSPWVGLSDDALYRLRHARPGVPLADALDVEVPGDDGRALAFARAWLGELQLLRDRVSCASLVERALDRAGYAAVLLHQEGGDVALANVRKLLRMADGRPGASIAELVAWMREREGSVAREREAALHTADEDVVTLSTVHGAKGLEWPVVFLCDLDRKPVGDQLAPRVYFDARDGIGVKLVDPDAPEGEEVSGAYQCLHARAGEREAAELLRVWYVASTRARERLVLCATPPGGGAAAPGRVACLLSGLTAGDGGLAYAHEGRRWQVCVADAPAAAEAVPREAPPAWSEVAALASVRPAVARRVALVPPVPPLFRRSATELMTFERDRAEHRRSYLLGLRLPPLAAGRVPNDGAAGALDARTTGDVVHALLEMDHEAVRRDLDGILERELADRIGAEAAAALPARDRGRLRRLVEDTLAHAAVARLHGGDALERELAFTWFVDVDGESSVLHGAMDLVGRVDGAFEILDYKTHALRPGEEEGVAEKYAMQRDLYAAALGALAGPPAAFSLFFPETGREVRAALDAAAVTGGHERVRERLRAVAAAVQRVPDA